MSDEQRVVWQTLVPGQPLWAELDAKDTRIAELLTALDAATARRSADEARLAALHESARTLLAADRAYVALIGHPDDTTEKAINETTHAAQLAYTKHLIVLEAWQADAARPDAGATPVGEV